jgi:hypothetical protein
MIGASVLGTCEASGGWISRPVVASISIDWDGCRVVGDSVGVPQHRTVRALFAKSLLGVLWSDLTG